MHAVIIVAAGTGQRMGGTVPKQFLPLCGKPVLRHAMEAFRQWDDDAQIIVVLPQNWIAYWKMICAESGCDIEHDIVAGGETRFYSVRNALAVLRPCTTVAVHDGVRPLVSQKLIRLSAMNATLHGAVIPVLPIVDTLRRYRNNRTATVNRNQYITVQTPQTFRTEWLHKAYQQPYNETFTDDASILESMRRPLKLIEGDPANIKITTPADLHIAEALLTFRSSHPDY
jgi:2-C-methyl-D-erythritol 4-phosphate cytidylyltransferase